MIRTLILLFLISASALADPKVLISGGGPAGMLTALRLVREGVSPHSILIVESRAEENWGNRQRLVSLTAASARAVREVLPHAETVLAPIEVFRVLSPTSESVNLPVDGLGNFGEDFTHIAMTGELERALLHQVRALQIGMRFETEIAALRADPRIHVRLAHRGQLEPTERTVTLLVIAEGARSRTRDLLGFGWEELPQIAGRPSQPRNYLAGLVQRRSRILDGSPPRGSVFVTPGVHNELYGQTLRLETADSTRLLIWEAAQGRSMLEVEQSVWERLARMESHREIPTAQFDEESETLVMQHYEARHGQARTVISEEGNVVVIGEAARAQDAMGGRGTNNAAADAVVVAQAWAPILRSGQAFSGDPRFATRIAASIRMQTRIGFAAALNMLDRQDSGIETARLLRTGSMTPELRISRGRRQWQLLAEPDGLTDFTPHAGAPMPTSSLHIEKSASAARIRVDCALAGIEAIEKNPL